MRLRRFLPDRLSLNVKIDLDVRVLAWATQALRGARILEGQVLDVLAKHR